MKEVLNALITSCHNELDRSPLITRGMGFSGIMVDDDLKIPRLISILEDALELIKKEEIKGFEMGDLSNRSRYHLGDCVHIEFDFDQKEFFLTSSMSIAIGDKIPLNPEYLNNLFVWLSNGCNSGLNS